MIKQNKILASAILALAGTLNGCAHVEKNQVNHNSSETSLPPAMAESFRSAIGGIVIDEKGTLTLVTPDGKPASQCAVDKESQKIANCKPFDKEMKITHVISPTIIISKGSIQVTLITGNKSQTICLDPKHGGGYMVVPCS